MRFLAGSNFNIEYSSTVESSTPELNANTFRIRSWNRRMMLSNNTAKPKGLTAKPSQMRHVKQIAEEKR